MTTDTCSTTKIERDNIVFHVFTSPEVGELVNSHVVETPNSLVVIDVPLYKPFAEEFQAYIASIGKPVAKVLITHAHPDHWFSLSHFEDHETYAFQEAIDEMAMLKDIAYSYHTSIHPDLVPDEIALPSQTIEEGPIEVDGITFDLQKVLDAEATATMVVEVPSVNTLLPQDLVYNRCHFYVATKTESGESSIGSWIEHLNRYRERGYELVIPGHGRPTDSSIFDEAIDYLTFARGVVESAKNGDELVSRITTQYPDYGLDLTLVMTGIMLFPPDAG